MRKQQEGYQRRRRRTLEERLATVRAGRAGANEVEKRRTGGTSNREKAKRKNFLMMRNSGKVTGKQVHSLKRQKFELGRRLKNLKKNAKVVQKVRRRRRH